MIKVSKKAIFSIVLVTLFSMIGCRGYAQPVDMEVTNTAFQDAMNEVLYPQEPNMLELSEGQVKKTILPFAAKIIAKTIKMVSEKTGQDINVADVFGALPPNIEDALNANKKQIKLQVEDILHGN